MRKSCPRPPTVEKNQTFMISINLSRPYASDEPSIIYQKHILTKLYPISKVFPSEPTVGGRGQKGLKMAIRPSVSQNSQ